MISDELSHTINRELQSLRAGSLTFWGNWFGRPNDNIHRVVGATSFAGPVVIYFDKGETLTVDEPRGWSFEDGRLVIREADRVRFQWFDYGQLPSPKSLRFEEYRWLDGQPAFETNFMVEDRKAVLDPRQAAVELRTS